MSAVPLWIQILQALLTPVIAIAVAVIGFLQWRTSHQKVVLDLSERRMKVLSDFGKAIDDYIASEGNLAGYNARAKLKQIRAEARLLFGSEITDYIDATVKKTVRRESIRKSIKDSTEIEDLTELSYNIYPIEAEVQSAKTGLAELMTPYLLMDHKRIRTPAEWLRDRNRIRLSYDDQVKR